MEHLGGSVTRRRFVAGAAGALVAGLVLRSSAVGADVPAAARATAVGYDEAVRQDNPVAYWRMDSAPARSEIDVSRHGLTGMYSGGRALTVLPNGDPATAFDGATGYLEIPDNPLLSPATTGQFTLEAWMRPDTLQFEHSESSGYVYWMGKGEPGRNEYVARMYSNVNTANRPNRVSGYAFNVDGGLGAGSYFQDRLRAGEWIHYVLVINPGARDTAYPHGYTKIYRDGVLRDQDQLEIDGVVITPRHSTAPLRVGTANFTSWFAGAVGKVAVYDRELTAERIATHTAAMTAPRGAGTLSVQDRSRHGDRTATAPPAVEGPK